MGDSLRKATVPPALACILPLYPVLRLRLRTGLDYGVRSADSEFCLTLFRIQFAAIVWSNHEEVAATNVVSDHEPVRLVPAGPLRRCRSKAETSFALR